MNLFNSILIFILIIIIILILLLLRVLYDIDYMYMLENSCLISPNDLKTEPRNRIRIDSPRKNPNSNIIFDPSSFSNTLESCGTYIRNNTRIGVKIILSIGLVILLLFIIYYYFYL